MDTAGNNDLFRHLTDIAQIASGICSAAGLGIAAAAAWLLALQTRANARIARENAALETHREYLRLCIDRPELSSSEAMLKSLKRDSFKGMLNEPLTFEKEQAQWFLSYVLDTVEQLIIISGGDKTWSTVGRSQIEYHKDLLIEFWPVYRKHYGLNLVRLVENYVLFSSEEAQGIQSPNLG